MAASEYRWWTVRAWREGFMRGLKLGLLTVAWVGARWYVTVRVADTWTLYDGVWRQIQRERVSS